jgi:glutathione reductase (NADPH)
LKEQGVKLDATGAVVVDAYSQSAVKGVYAVGDVTNRVNLTPMAIREGHAFADTVFGKQVRTVDHTLVPSAVFTTPEAGTVGLTEAQALQKYPHLDVYRSTFRPMKATLSGHTSKVFLKLLVDRDTDKVLGFHAVGPDTGEMAQLVGITLQLGATKAAFDATLAVHPTAAEELVTMRAPAVQHNL